MPTDAGRMFRIMATYGFRTSPTVGLRIATATGFGNPITAGPGSDTSRGAGLRITTGAGSGTAVPGRGGLDRCGAATTRSGRLPTSPFGDGAGVRALASDGAAGVGAALAGFRSVRVTGSIRGGVDIAGASVSSAVPTSILVTTVDLLRCMAERVSRTSRTFTTITSSTGCRRSGQATLAQVT